MNQVKDATNSFVQSDEVVFGAIFFVAEMRVREMKESDLYLCKPPYERIDPQNLTPVQVGPGLVHVGYRVVRVQLQGHIKILVCLVWEWL